VAAQKHVDARVQQGVGRGAAFAAVPAAAIVALAKGRCCSWRLAGYRNTPEVLSAAR